MTKSNVAGAIFPIKFAVVSDEKEILSGTGSH
jgi:hypothetical protein